MFYPAEFDRDKAKKFAISAISKFTLAFATAVGRKLGEKIVEIIFSEDEEEEEDDDTIEGIRCGELEGTRGPSDPDYC